MKYIKVILGLLTAIYLVVGILFLIISVVVSSNNNEFRANAFKTKAEIISLNDEKALVEYTNEKGKTVQRYLNEFSSSMYTGQTLNVYIDENNPDKIITDSNIMTTVFCAVGAGFVALGCVFLIINFVVIKKINKYIDNNPTGQNDLPECFRE